MPDGSPAATTRTQVLVALALAGCLVAGSTPRVIGDGREYLAQALTFTSLDGPSLGRQAIPALERRVADVDSTLADWNIAEGSTMGADRRRDFVHFWFYPLLASPFVWLAEQAGASPLVGFTVLNIVLLGAALRVALSRIAAPVVVLLFASPLVWWIDKAHTEVFTASLITIAMLTLRDRPALALVAAGAACTQNPPISILLVAIGAVVFHKRGREALRDRALLAGAAAGALLAALQPAYMWWRHDTPSLLLGTTRPGTPTLAEVAGPLLDPSMGLVGNFPVFLIGTMAAAGWLSVRHWRRLAAPEAIVALVAGAGFLVAFAQSANGHHGGTPSLSRYALWLLPLSLAVWQPWWSAAGRRAHRSLAAAAVCSAVISVFAFHPSVDEGSREPTALASWLWTRHPGWNNPLPEVFSETLTGVDPMSAPVATDGCEKVLVVAGNDGDPIWPLPCLPADLPPMCAAPGTLCYANRHGANYDFVVAPGRHPVPRREIEGAWPAVADAHVRRIYLEANWAALVDDSEPLAVLRAQHDVRVAPAGTDARFLLVLRPTGATPALHLRSAHPLRGQLIDAMTGATMMTLAHDGPAETLWVIDLPDNNGHLMIMTMHQQPAPAAP